MVALLLLFAFAPPQGKTLVAPYIQLGENDQAAAKSVTVVWHTASANALPANYKVGDAPWQTARSLSPRKVAFGRVPTHYVQMSEIHELSAGASVRYEAGGKSGTFIAPKAGDTPYSFLAVGDIGRGTPGQKKLAGVMADQEADFAVLLGDIAYPNGRLMDYRNYFFPIQNADTNSPTIGAAVLRNTLTIPVTGNHDTAFRNLERYSDGLAFYAYWLTPDSGPKMPLKIKGTPAQVNALNEASGGKLGRIGNYSFSYGNSRWVILDSNVYVDWQHPAMREWLEGELQKSQSATWSFVAMHVPPYHSSKTHAGDTNTRAIVDLFTKYKVDIMFAGHIHNYQRSLPMKTDNGSMTLDRAFDGKSITQADGTIHIISGGGGGELYDRAQGDDPTSWQSFTAQLKSVHSVTRVDVKGRELMLRQIDADGRTIDEIRLTK
ncbi:MAG: metallophosphoesterase [Fimbriimonas sp.]